MTYPDLRVLWSRSPDAPMAPSSMTKLMTVLLVFDEVVAGRLRLDETVTVAAAATKTRGSRLRLKPGDKVKADLLLQATIVYSANDAAIALAIRVAGSEAAFGRRMTERARSIGLARSAFANATGFSAPGHVMTAREVALLSAYLITRYPKAYQRFKARQLRFRGRTYRNRNPILGRVDGADGLKTGQTRAGGFGLAASAERGGRRLILVINGLPDAKTRAAEARALLEWGFRHYAPAR